MSAVISFLYEKCLRRFADLPGVEDQPRRAYRHLDAAPAGRSPRKRPRPVGTMPDAQMI